MEKFPGYTPKTHLEKATLEIPSTQANLQRARMVLTVLQTALPLLKEHCQSSALPVEVHRGVLGKRTKIQAGWIVERNLSHPGSESYTSCESIIALMENSTIARAEIVHRGIEALEAARPVNLSMRGIQRLSLGGKKQPSGLAYDHRSGRSMATWQFMKEKIGEHLYPAGIDFDACLQERLQQA
jgi:hypothetical protein